MPRAVARPVTSHGANRSERVSEARAGGRALPVDATFDQAARRRGRSTDGIARDAVSASVPWRLRNPVWPTSANAGTATWLSGLTALRGLWCTLGGAQSRSKSSRRRYALTPRSLSPVGVQEAYRAPDCSPSMRRTEASAPAHPAVNRAISPARARPMRRRGRHRHGAGSRRGLRDRSRRWHPAKLRCRRARRPSMRPRCPQDAHLPGMAAFGSLGHLQGLRSSSAR